MDNIRFVQINHTQNKLRNRRRNSRKRLEKFSKTPENFSERLKGSLTVLEMIISTKMGGFRQFWVVFHRKSTFEDNNLEETIFRITLHNTEHFNITILARHDRIIKT